MLCCIPNCNANSSSKNPLTNDNAQRSCFKFPTNKSLKDEWLRLIPVKKFSKNTGVCISHFEERFIKRSSENPLKGRLVPGAVPTIFLKDESPNDQNAVSEEVIEIDANVIESFDNLKSDIETVLQLDDWKVASSAKYLHIYKLTMEDSGNLKVETSINIDSDLVLKVFHRDKPIGMKFSQQTVHRSLKLKGWSHLQKFLDKFNNTQGLNIHSEKIRYE